MNDGDWDDPAGDNAGWNGPRSGDLAGGGQRRDPGQRRSPDQRASPGRPGNRDQGRPPVPGRAGREEPRAARANGPGGLDDAEPVPLTQPIRSKTTGPAGKRPAPPPKRRRRWPLITGYSVLGLVSLLVLGLTGFAWATYNSVLNKVHTSNVLSSSGDKKSLNGDTNILIMGLDTRLDENGNPLPQNIYDALHAGDSTVGGENANVLMLLHVPGDGSQATEISIPRDDYVDLPGAPDGVHKEKIKEAYGLAFDQEHSLLYRQGVTGAALEQQSRDAGRQEEIKTVEQFLGGIAIDHFVEVTLVAFFEIAQVVAPIPVCVLYPTSDNYSGANFQAGTQELNASQALAFVRQRRDIGVASLGRISDYYTQHNLDFTDLDRERRQQAFIASLAHKLKQAGTISSPTQLSQILNVAESNIAVDSGLNLLQFAQQASNLTGGNVTFQTLPIAGYENAGTAANPNDVNAVNVPQIQAIVRALLGGGSAGQPATTSAAATATSAGPPPTGTVDVYNASGQAHMAATVEDALVSKGFTKGTTGNEASTRSTSIVEYGSGASATASAVAGVLGGLTTQSSSSVSSGHVRVILGTAFSLPSGMSTASSTPTSAVPAPSLSAPSNNGNNDADKNPMSSISGNGVPCVK